MRHSGEGGVAYIPRRFNWGLFLAGLSIILWGVLDIRQAYQRRAKAQEAPSQEHSSLNKAGA